MKKGWTYKKLGEVGTFTRGGGFLKRDYVDKGIPCIHYGQIHMLFGPVTRQHITSIPESLRTKTKFASKGDVIFAITSEDVEGSCKCTAWMGDYEVAVGGHTAIFKHQLNPAYISYYAQSPKFNKAKEAYTHGFKVVEIKPADIAKIEIPVPSLSEQQRIVKRLDSAFAHIDALKANAEKTIVEARALFQKSLSKAMEPKEGWEEKKLGNVCEIKSILVDPKEFQYKQLLHVGGANIVSETGKLIDLKTAEEEGLTSGKFTFNDNDVLYNKIRPYLIKVSRPDFLGLCSADMYPLTPKNGMTRDYLYYILVSHDFTDYAIKNSARAGMPKLNRQALFAYKCMIPPLSEQQYIVKRLDSLSSNLREFENIQRKIIAECDALKQALLRKVFE